jgi:outer membrane autotransporter protein
MTQNKKLLCIAIGSVLAGNAFAVANITPVFDICNENSRCVTPIKNPCNVFETIHQVNLSEARMSNDERSISCDPANAASQALFNITNLSFTSIGSRIDNLRDADLIAYAPASLQSMQANHRGVASGIVATKEIKHGAWVKAIGNNTRQDQRNGFDGYKSSSAGVTIGADTRLDNDMIVGGAFTYIDTDVNARDTATGSGSEIKSYQGTGYLSRDYGTWHLDALLAYTKQQNKTQRVVGPFNMTGKFDGDLFSTRVTAGKRIAVANSKMVVTPFVSLQYDHLKQDGYTENGLAPLTVNRTTASRLTSGLGARLVTEATVAGRQIKPSVTAQWLHEFKQEGLNTSGTVGGGAFVSEGQKAIKNILGLGTSVMMPVGRNAAVSVGYNYEGATKYQSHGYELVYQYWF